MSINNASYWLLFFAMSRNQESYFSRLKQDMAVGGVVLNAKHPGWGGRFSALEWPKGGKAVPIWFDLEKHWMPCGGTKSLQKPCPGWDSADEWRSL